MSTSAAVVAARVILPEAGNNAHEAVARAGRVAPAGSGSPAESPQESSSSAL